MQPMQEIELKLQIPPGQLPTLHQALLERGICLGPAQALKAIYFDTPGRALAAARAALRLRCEDGIWVQTFKAAQNHALVRLEDNRPMPASAGDPESVPHLDLAVYAGSPIQARLAQTLDWSPDLDPKGEHSGLQAWYGTDIQRQRANVEVRGQLDSLACTQGCVELAWDIGHIRAGAGAQARALRVCELEIEALSGDAMAVVLEARYWIERCGLWLDLRSKAQRGDTLARRGRRRPRPSTARAARQAQLGAASRRALGPSSTASTSASVSVSVSQCVSNWVSAFSDMGAWRDSDEPPAALLARWRDACAALLVQLQPRRRTAWVRRHDPDADVRVQLACQLRRLQVATPRPRTPGSGRAQRLRQHLDGQRMARLARSRHCSLVALTLLAQADCAPASGSP